MARTHGKLLSSTWDDDDFLALSTHARLLYLALFSQADITPAGVLPITAGRWRRYIDSPPASRNDVYDVLQELASARFVIVDDDTEEVWLRSFMRHDGRLENPNLRASISTALTTIRSNQLRAAAVAEFERISPGNTPCHGDSDAVPTPSATAVELLEPAAQSQGPTASSQQPRHSRPATNGIEPTLSSAAAAAIEILVSHRISTEPDVRNPQRYANTIRTNETAAHLAELATVTDNDDPVTVAQRIFGLSSGHAIRADYTRRHGATA